MNKIPDWTLSIVPEANPSSSGNILARHHGILRHILMYGANMADRVTFKCYCSLKLCILIWFLTMSRPRSGEFLVEPYGATNTSTAYQSLWGWSEPLQWVSVDPLVTAHGLNSILKYPVVYSQKWNSQWISVLGSLKTVLQWHRLVIRPDPS